MKDLPLEGKTILITGGARRLGRVFALATARAGANIVLHYSSSPDLAEDVAAEIRSIGRKVVITRADFSNPAGVEEWSTTVWNLTPIDAIVNNAAIFEPLSFEHTSLEEWQRHLNINLTVPFLLSKTFSAHLPQDKFGRIVNILDWRALRPGTDHFPYTISKAALASLTKSLAQALAPRITVNGIALGAILPPSDHTMQTNLLASVPAGRWADLDEVEQTLLFLLTGPSYITGEVIHLDGGRHLV